MTTTATTRTRSMRAALRRLGGPAAIGMFLAAVAIAAVGLTGSGSASATSQGVVAPPVSAPSTAPELTLVFDPTTTSCGTLDLELKMPLNNGITVDWGDGTSDTWSYMATPSHTYLNEDTHVVKVTGALDQWGDQNVTMTGSSCITGVTSFGELGLMSVKGAFEGMSNLTEVPVVIPASITDLSYLFHSLTLPNPIDVSSWDVSHVVTMESMFEYSNFDGDVSGWRPSVLTNAARMFSNDRAFNHPVDAWTPAALTNAGGMFASADGFNSSVAGLVGPSVTATDSMFSGASAFNQPLSSWDVSGVTTMENMFNNAGSFDQDLSGWKPTSLTNASSMFVAAMMFKHSVGAWPIPKLTSAANMFENYYPRASYTDTLVGWAASATNSHTVDLGVDQEYRIAAVAAHATLLGWGWTIADRGLYVPQAMVLTFDTTACGTRTVGVVLSGVKELTAIDWGDGVPSSVSADGGSTHTFVTNGTFDVSLVGWFEGYQTALVGLPCLTAVKTWGEPGITDLTGAFASAPRLAHLPSNFPSSVTSLEGTFANVSTLDTDVSGWDVSNVHNFTGTFQGANLAHVDITGWNMTGANHLDRMFQASPNFNQDINGWYVANVTSFDGMLSGTSFNHSLDRWRIHDLATMRSFLPTTMSADNYAATLQGWASNQATGRHVTLEAPLVKYRRTAADAHASLISARIWTFTDGGQWAVRPTAPGKPRVAFASGVATITWSLPYDGDSAITRSNVTIYSGTTSAATCTGATATSTSCTISTLTYGTTYTAKVTATNAIGTSDASPASDSFTPQGPPGAPTSITAERGSTVVRVSWTAPATNGVYIDKYTVLTYQGTTPKTMGCTSTGNANTPAVTNCIVTGLTNGTAYTFKVKAHNSKGDTTATLNASAAVTPIAVPSMIDMNNRAAGVVRQDTKLVVTWPLPADNGFAITKSTATAYKPDGTTAGTCTATGATATTCTISNVSNTVEYTVKVRATNSKGDGLLSELKLVPAATRVTAPTLVTATAGARGSKKITISWSAPENMGRLPLKGYTVKKDGVAVANCTNITNYSCDVTGLTSGKSYSFTVTAYTAFEAAGTASAAVSRVAP